MRRLRLDLTFAADFFRPETSLNSRVNGLFVAKAQSTQGKQYILMKTITDIIFATTAPPREFVLPGLSGYDNDGQIEY